MSIVAPRIRHSLALAVTLLATTSVATDPAAAEQGSRCTDKAWADYNTCLVNARYEWQREECDSDFYFDYILCTLNPFNLIAWY